MSIASFALQTNFNVKNAMASSTLFDLMRVRKETIRNCMADFENEAHRLEPVLKINGCQYINDAQATNVNATYYALESMEHETVWIAEGMVHSSDYKMLLPLINEKVKAIICIGDNNDNLIETFGNIVDFMFETNSIEQAVKIAYKLSRDSETVLYSPAAKSLDETETFEKKGNKFKEAIRQL